MALVACPKCGVTLEVPENLLGQQVRCASCATVFEARVQEMVPPRGASSDLPATSEEKTERHSDLDVADRTKRRQRRWSHDAADEDDGDDSSGSGDKGTAPPITYAYKDKHVLIASDAEVAKQTLRRMKD